MQRPDGRMMRGRRSSCVIWRRGLVMTEYRYERQIHHVWHCLKCDSRFETIVETKVTEDVMTSDEIFPSRMVR